MIGQPTWRSRGAWLGGSAAIVAVAVLGIAAVLELGGGAEPPFLSGAPPAAEAIAREAGDATHEILHIAGSGSNVPLTRALAAAYATNGAARPIVYPSIGSGGGVRALVDGAIAIAIVSRPLHERERAHGLVVTPYARVPVVVALHPNVPDRRLSTAEFLDAYRGRKTTWSDGAPLVVLQRERGDSSHEAVARVLPEFAAINDAAYRDGRFRVLYHDDDMEEALVVTEGALGLQGSGTAIGSPSHVAAAIDGVLPTPEAIASGRYPFVKSLAFVTVGPPTGEAAAFIAFTQSPAGRAVIEAHGCLPEGAPG